MSSVVGGGSGTMVEESRKMVFEWEECPENSRKEDTIGSQGQKKL